MRDRRKLVGGDLAGLRVTVGKSGDAGRVAICPQRVDQLFKNHFAVTAHDIIHVLSFQADIPVLGREIAAPDDSQARMPQLELAAVWHGGADLWARHDGNAKDIGAGLVNGTVDSGDRVVLDIAVDDDVVVFALQQRADGQQRHRQDVLASGGALRVVEDEHLGDPSIHYSFVVSR